MTIIYAKTWITAWSAYNISLMSVGYSKENVKIHTGVSSPPFLSSLTLPSPSSPSLAFPPSPLRLPSYIPLPLEVGLLNPGERCKLPRLGLGPSPMQPKSILVHFSLKI